MVICYVDHWHCIYIHLSAIVHVSQEQRKTFTSNFCRCRSVYLHIAKMCRNVCSECSDRSGADFLSLLWDLGLGRHVSMVWRCLEWRLQYPESRNYGLHIIKYRWRQLVQMPRWQKSPTIQKAIGDSCGLLLLYAVSEHCTLHSKHSQTSLTCLGPGPRWWFIDICVSSVCATWQTIVSWPPPPARHSGFLKYISYNLQLTHLVSRVQSCDTHLACKLEPCPGQT